MYIPLSFELNDDEIAQLEALHSLIKLTPLGGDNKEQPPRITSLEELLRIEANISRIRGKARARSLGYYASHIDQLVTALRDEIRDRVIEQANWENSGIFSVLASTKKENITQSILPYLAILNDSERSEILAYIDYAFTNRQKIYREAMRKERETQTYEAAKAKRVKKITSTVDKVTQSVFNPSKNTAFFTGGVDLVMGKKGRNEVTTAVSMSIENLAEVKFSNGAMLNPYCRAVMDAVNSLYNAGNKLLSACMIHRTMTGKNIPEEKARSAIYEAIDALMHTVIDIDATQEAKAFGFEAFKFKGQLLPAQFVTAKINGQTVDCLKLLAEPPLLAYARRKRQLSSYDVRLLNAPFEALSATQENIIIVNYLLDRIMGMLNPKNRLQNVIRYNSLYEHLSLEAPTQATLETKRRRIRQTVHTVLDTWIKTGLISSYEDLDEDNKPARKGRTVAKVIIRSAKKRIAS